jgi:hypothetical protein
MSTQGRRLRRAALYAVERADEIIREADGELSVIRLACRLGDTGRHYACWNITDPEKLREIALDAAADALLLAEACDRATEEEP